MSQNKNQVFKKNHTQALENQKKKKRQCYYCEEKQKQNKTKMQQASFIA